MEKEVVILDIDYVSYEDKPVIRLFSKDGDKNVVIYMFIPIVPMNV